MMRTLFLAVLTATMPTTTIHAATLCNPRDNAARILSSPAPNDIHPDWSGESRIGLGNSFAPKQAMKDRIAGNIEIYRGNLYSTRGGLTNEGVFVIAKEWECSNDWNGKIDADGNIPWLSSDTRGALSLEPLAAEQQPINDPLQRDVYYRNCSAARAAGAAPIRVGEPGYRRKLDRDGDGVACE